MNVQNSYVILTQLVGTIFVLVVSGITIALSEIGAPGGSLLNVLAAEPLLLVPIAVLGGLFILLVLASIGLYVQAKPDAEP